MNWRPLFFLCVFPSLALAQTPAPLPTLPSVDLPPALDRVLRDYEKAWQAGDASALSRLFAEDGYVLSSASPPVRGREAIRAIYSSNKGGPLSLRALAYATDGSIGYIIGAFGTKAGSPDAGKFTLTLRKGSDGQWLIMSDMDNLNQQPRRAPPAPSEKPS